MSLNMCTKCWGYIYLWLRIKWIYFKYFKIVVPTNETKIKLRDSIN